MDSPYYETGRAKRVAEGREKTVQTIDFNPPLLYLDGKFILTARPFDHFSAVLQCPQKIVDSLRKMTSLRVDILSFSEQLTCGAAQSNYYFEMERRAVIKVSSYADWFNDEVHRTVRRRIRQSEREGVTVKRISFDDHFINAMAEIFNENPVRQGRRFWHFGKSAETLKRHFSNLESGQEIYGAYWRNELIGFMCIGCADQYIYTTQVISAIKHRDKAPNNALIAQGIKICAERSVRYFWYGDWPPVGTFQDFKRYNGFAPMQVPRYYIPLTWKGQLALRFGLHRDWKDALPQDLRKRLKSVKAELSEIRARVLL